MRKVTKVQKTLTAIIETEGGTVLGVREGANHQRIDYTFDHHQVHTQTLPRGTSVEHRWEMNFRSAVRKSKRQHEA